jgi:hypothetical protein
MTYGPHIVYHLILWIILLEPSYVQLVTCCLDYIHTATVESRGWQKLSYLWMLTIYYMAHFTKKFADPSCRNFIQISKSLSCLNAGKCY